MSAPWLEIIIPVRNPGDPFEGTINSLVAQSDREFGVALSDNYSSSGLDRLESARARLEESGIQARRIRPPFQLSRVEHWNWAHHSSDSLWLKPLFVGDTIDREYVSRLRQRVQSAPSARLVRCSFKMITRRSVVQSLDPPVACDRLTREEFLNYYPLHGNWLGSPINFAYERTAFRGAGGFSTQLPGCADLNLFVSLALRHGIELLPESLATFHLHEERFSHGIHRRRVIGSLELWFILRQAYNYCVEQRLPWPRGGVWRGTWKQVKIDYWDSRKPVIKEYLRQLGLRQ